MDPQTLFNLTFGIISSGLGWFAKTLYTAVQELRSDLNQLRVKIADDYVPTQRYEATAKRFEDKLDRILDKLEHKVDR
jgi:hypothetical protein